MTVQFELVTPENLDYEGGVDMVIIPAEDGDMGILPQHSPVVTTLRPGVICLFSGGKVVERFFVPSGFGEITPERCTVMAEKSYNLAETHYQEVQRLIAEAKDDLAMAQSEEEKQSIHHQLQILTALLNAVEKPPYGHA